MGLGTAPGAGTPSGQGWTDRATWSRRLSSTGGRWPATRPLSRPRSTGSPATGRAGVDHRRVAHEPLAVPVPPRPRRRPAHVVALTQPVLRYIDHRRAVRCTAEPWG